MRLCWKHVANDVVTKMRLNWFSPLLPERTDIAHYTTRLAPALLKRFDIVFWTETAADPQLLPFGAKIQHFDAGHIDGRDFNSQLFEGLNVYNFGNDARFHAGIFKVAQNVPGLAVMHDTRLHHFVFELYRHADPPWDGYIDLAARLYGRHGEAQAKQIAAREGRSIDEFVENMPFIEAIADDAIAVICHSRTAMEDIRQRCDAPVLMMQLPYESLVGNCQFSRDWAPPWRFVTYGYLNPNRRLESILRALGELKARIDFRLDVFGTLWDPSLIDAIVARSGLSSRVKVHGFVSEQMLDEAIASAHLSFNLRHPTMGEASGSILRSWASATPALVTKAGWYADLPDTVAMKISTEDEICDIERAVSKLDSEPQLFKAMGVSARRRLDEVHSPHEYAAALAEAASDLPRLMTRRAGRRMLQQVASDSRSPMEQRVFLDRAAATIGELFSLH